MFKYTARWFIEFKLGCNITTFSQIRGNDDKLHCELAGLASTMKICAASSDVLQPKALKQNFV